MSSDMLPDPFVLFYHLENPMTDEEICTQCAKIIKVQIMKGSGVCCENCRKERDKELPETRALTDAGITALLNQPTGEMNLRGIR